jgi:hypothetical protein
MKSHKNTAFICLGILLFLPAAAPAQDGGASPSPIHVRAGKVTDTRFSSKANFSKCEIELIFTGDALRDAGTVRRVHVTKAIDDLGTNVTMWSDSGDAYPSEMSDSVRRDSELRTHNEIRMRVGVFSPGRNAITLKILKGELELFNPTLTNGGRLIIPGVLQHPGEVIQSPGLAKCGIQMKFITKDPIEAEKHERSASGLFGVKRTGGQGCIQMDVEGPYEQIVTMNFLDGKGLLLPGSGNSMSYSYGWLTIGLACEPPPDTQMVLELRVPEALRTFPFTVENIPLP